MTNDKKETLKRGSGSEAEIETGKKARWMSTRKKNEEKCCKMTTLIGKYTEATQKCKNC